MKEMNLDEAIKAAIELNSSIELEGIHIGYTNLEVAVQNFQDEGYPIESLIPKGGDASMGFSLSNVTGKNFWNTYSKLIRKQLCEKEGELNKLVQSGVSTSVGAILTAIVTTLGVPAIALGIMIPIAVIIVNTGVDAFCEITDDEPK